MMLRIQVRNVHVICCETRTSRLLSQVYFLAMVDIFKLEFGSLGGYIVEEWWSVMARCQTIADPDLLDKAT